MTGTINRFEFQSSDPNYKIRIILNANDFGLPGIKPDDCEDDDHIFLDTVRTGVFMCGTYNRKRDFDSQANEMTATFFVNEKMRDKGFRLIVTAIPGMLNHLLMVGSALKILLIFFSLNWPVAIGIRNGQLRPPLMK